MPASDDLNSRDTDFVQLEAHCKAATPGPWRVLDDPDVDCSWLNADGEDDKGPIALYDYRDRDANRANAEFAAHARLAVPRLIAEVRALRIRVRELLDANTKEVERRTQALRERDEAIGRAAGGKAKG